MKHYLVSWTTMSVVLFAVTAENRDKAREACGDTLKNSTGCWGAWEVAPNEVSRLGLPSVKPVKVAMTQGMQGCFKTTV